MELIKFDELQKNWHQIARNENGDIASNFQLEIYKKMLDLFQPGEFYYYIFNPAKVEIEYISAQIKKVFNINPEEFNILYILNKIHPDDKNRFFAYEHKVTEFFNNLPPDKTTKYKVSYDYRLPNVDGSYKWILQQTTTIQTNDKGAVIRVIGVHTDITHLKIDNKPSGLSFLGLDGEPSYINVNIDKDSFQQSNQDLFSKREHSILCLIIQGKETKEIANILNISIHTVNSHRKSILYKSNCKSLVELGAKAVSEGWI